MVMSLLGDRDAQRMLLREQLFSRGACCARSISLGRPAVAHSTYVGEIQATVVCSGGDESARGQGCAAYADGGAAAQQGASAAPTQFLQGGPQRPEASAAL